MTFNKKKTLIVKKVIIILLIPLLVYFVYNKIINIIHKPHLSKRALVLFVENSHILMEEDIQFYEDNKELIHKFISLLYRVDKSELEGKDAIELTDIYGEPFMADFVIKASKNYGHIILLTDEVATLEDLAISLEQLSAQGYVVDLILNVHGSGESYVFGEKIVSSHQIYSRLYTKNINFGFVYQTACYGSQQLNLWKDLGAKVVNGSKDINYFPIFAPAIFMQSWTRGKAYEAAVNKGYETEVFIYKAASNIATDLKSWITSEKISSSKMLYLGSKDLTIKN